MLYGKETISALQNFQLSRHRLGAYPLLVRALLRIKRAAARASADLEQLPRPIASAIAEAAGRLLEHLPPEQFPVDLLRDDALRRPGQRFGRWPAAQLGRRLMRSARNCTREPGW
jgi:aspartate ammonia-lyase